MGVRGLWKILLPIREIVTVESLRGKVLAIDLAIWVVEAQLVTGNTVHGVYLRNLFFKVCHLLEHGIGVIVVVDGKAPILKAQTIANRLGVSLDRNSKVIQRRRFQKILKECETLLIGLGIPVIRASGEAEASAAKLCSEGKADGVVTSDGDAFLYGARVVYRNLIVSEECCEKYDMSRVEYELGLCRDDLIGLGILLGCDFNPNGVGGISKVGALKYISSRDRMRSVTEELSMWNKDRDQIRTKYKQLSDIKTVPHCSVCKHNGSKKEHNSSGCSQCPHTPCTSSSSPCQCIKHVSTRLLSSPHMQCCVKFTGMPVKIPAKEIVMEFLNIPSTNVDSIWQVPHGYDFVNLMHQKLEWRRCNAAIKFSHVAALQLISQNITYSKPFTFGANNVVKFNHILKKRVKDGVDMLELEFQIVDKSLVNSAEFDILYVILQRSFVEEVLPAAVEDFLNNGVIHKRKKKDSVPIYEKYPAKSPPPILIIEEKPKQKPKKKTTKASSKAKKKIEVNIVEEVTDEMETVDLNSSDEEILPLAERLARRKNSNLSTQSSLTSLATESEKSAPKWMSSSSLSSGSVSDDKENVNPKEIDEVEADYDAEHPRPSSELEPEDSNIQIIPDEFMAEYLDLSRNEILEISQNNEMLAQEEEEEAGFSRENTFELSESVNSDDYKRRISDMDYNQLAFVTPVKPQISSKVSIAKIAGQDIGEDLSAGYLGLDDPDSFTDVSNLTHSHADIDYGVNDMDESLESANASFGLRVNDSGTVIVGVVNNEDDVKDNVADNRGVDSFVIQEDFNDESLIELTKAMNLSGNEVETKINILSLSQNVSFIDPDIGDSQIITDERNTTIPQEEDASSSQHDLRVTTNLMTVEAAQPLHIVSEEDEAGYENRDYFDDMDPELESELVKAAEQLVLDVERGGTAQIKEDIIVKEDIVHSENLEHLSSFVEDDSIIEIEDPRKNPPTARLNPEPLPGPLTSSTHPSIIPSISTDTPNLTLDSTFFSLSSSSFSPAPRLSSINNTFTTPSKLPDISSFSPVAPLSPIPQLAELDDSQTSRHGPVYKSHDISPPITALAEYQIGKDLSLDKTDSLSLDTTGNLSLDTTCHLSLDTTGHLSLDKTSEELSLARHAPLPEVSRQNTFEKTEIPPLLDNSTVLPSAPILLAEDTFEDISILSNHPLPDVPSGDYPREASSPPFIPPNMTPTMDLAINPNLHIEPPLEPFIDPVFDVTTPVWKKKPLSDITNTSTPNSSQRTSSEVIPVNFEVDPLPDITSNTDLSDPLQLEKRFDIDISNLLNQT